MLNKSRDELFDELKQVNSNIMMAKGSLKESENKRDELNARHSRLVIEANEERKKELLNKIHSLKTD